jgi:hypothetical protein
MDPRDVEPGQMHERRMKKFLNVWIEPAVVALFLLLTALPLSGCMDPDPIVAVPPTETPQLPTPTVVVTATPRPQPVAMNFPLPAPVHVGIERPNDEGCIACHTDRESLRASAGASEVQGGLSSSGVDGPVAPDTVEDWQKVYLDQPSFLETVHGRYGCIACHSGNGDTRLKETAHRSMIFEPSAVGICGDCHTREVAGDENSLHTNLTGYRTVLLARSSLQHAAEIEMVMDNHCEGCHTSTCGQCHVIEPASLGGGLIAGHVFIGNPDVNSTCGGCHSSRIENEYKGQNGDLPGDVHWVQGKMLCSDCHGAGELHGTIKEFVHRYDGQLVPDCQSVGCHPEVNEDDGIEQHDRTHLLALSCQACHTTAYTNCSNCHVRVENGKAAHQVDPPQIAFKIGLNPIASRYRPWKYVPVRHVPIAPDSFAYYGENLLPNFDAMPTWKYATPHNIQRITPQTKTCNSCHGNNQVFLTAADVALDEWAANQDVIVDRVPDRVE